MVIEAQQLIAWLPKFISMKISSISVGKSSVFDDLIVMLLLKLTKYYLYFHSDQEEF